MIIFTPRCNVEIVRKNGTTINVPHKKHTDFKYVKPKNTLIIFFVATIFLSIFIYFTPIAKIDNSLDDMLHQTTAALPVICSTVLILMEVLPNRGKREKRRDLNDLYY